MRSDPIPTSAPPSSIKAVVEVVFPIAGEGRAGEEPSRQSVGASAAARGDDGVFRSQPAGIADGHDRQIQGLQSVNQT
jgi:hypothetical protein